MALTWVLVGLVTRQMTEEAIRSREAVACHTLGAILQWAQVLLRPVVILMSVALDASLGSEDPRAAGVVSKKDEGGPLGCFWALCPALHEA